jgi:hypothetical protein
LRNLDLVAEARSPDRRVVIAALGIAQILAWGTSFYFPAVFAEPIVAETGWSLGFVVGGTSIGLLTAGLISPQVGRTIDVHGGRPVLMASSLFYAAGLALVGFSPALPIFLAGWADRPWHGQRPLRCRVRRTWPHVWQQGARTDRQSRCLEALLARSVGR